MFTGAAADSSNTMSGDDGNNNNNTNSIANSMAVSFIKSVCKKFLQFLRTLPLVTSILVGSITMGYILEWMVSLFHLLGSNDNFISFRARSIIENPGSNWYRMITYHFFHKALYQFLIVSASMLFVLGRKSERSIGSLLLTFIVIVGGMILQPFLNLLLSWLCYKFLSMNVFYDEYCRGFSGILFLFLAYEYGTSKQRIPIPFMESNNNNNDESSSSSSSYIPVNTVPWILLFVAEIVFWNSSSFLSHLSGVVVGYLFTMTKRLWMTPLGTFFHAYLERDNDADGIFFRCCTGQTNFVSTPDAILYGIDGDEGVVEEGDGGDDPDYRPLETTEF